MPVVRAQLTFGELCSPSLNRGDLERAGLARQARAPRRAARPAIMYTIYMMGGSMGETGSIHVWIGSFAYRTIGTSGT